MRGGRGGRRFDGVGGRLGVKSSIWEVSGPVKLAVIFVFVLFFFFLFILLKRNSSYWLNRA